jgi:hypothetical protein
MGHEARPVGNAAFLAPEAAKPQADLKLQPVQGTVRAAVLPACGTLTHGGVGMRRQGDGPFCMSKMKRILH